MNRSRTKRRRRFTAAELRALASAGLTITRYSPDGQRATVEQLTEENRPRSSFYATTPTHESKTEAEGG